MILRTDKQIIEGARLAVFNTEKNADRQKQMGNYGFTSKRMQEGKTLLENVMLLQDLQTSQYNERWIISNQLKADRQAALTLFKDHITVARTTFRHDPAVLHTLQIKRISKKISEWPQQALYFYTQLEDHLAALAPFGLNAEVITQAKASVQALIEMKEDRTDRKSKAEDSTQEKRKAFKALKAWVTEFRSIARVAFKDNPQVLEAFGIVVTSKV